MNPPRVALLVHKTKLANPELQTTIQTVPPESCSELVFFDDKEELFEKLKALKSKKIDRALVCGGDGTLHCVLEEMLKLNESERLPLAIVPLGTANDFATAAGFAKDGLQEAIRRSIEEPLQNVDVGWVNGHPFINVVTGGAVARNTTDISPTLKASFGKFAYYINALVKTATVTEYPTVFSGEGWEITEPSFAFAVGNSSSAGGGFKVAPDAKLNDGLLDLMVIPKQNLLNLASLAAELVKDEPSFDGHQIYFRRSNRFSLSCPSEIQLNLDGEPIKGTHFDFSVSPKAVSLAVSRERLLC